MTDTQVSSLTVTPAGARRAARNAGAIALARILSSAALFLWQLVLIPLLGPAAYGTYGTVAALFLVGAAVAAFGIGQVIIRDVARQPQRAGDFLSAALVLQTLLAALAYVGINAAAALFGYSQEVRAFVALAGLSLFIDQLGTMAYENLLAHERMVTTAMVDIAAMAARIGSAWLLLQLGFGLLGVYAAAIISGLLRAAVLWWALARGGVSPRFPLDRPLARRVLTDAAPLAAGSFVGQAYTHADKLVTAGLIGSRAVGYLTAALTIVIGMVEILSTTVLIAVYPMMSRVYATENRAYFRGIVEKLAFFTLLTALPVALPISVFADLLTLLFGMDFLPSAGVLRILIWYGLLTMIAAIYAQALMVQNRQRLTLAIRAAGLLLNLALLFALLPTLGVRGAPVASLIAETLVLTGLVWAFRRHEPEAAAAQTDSAASRSALLRVLAAAALAALAMVTLGSIHAALGIGGGLAVYAGALLTLQALRRDDWGLIDTLLEAVPGGSHLARLRRRWASQDE
jgi:O-antigen/teichoic acid export membrane protein